VSERLRRPACRNCSWPKAQQSNAMTAGWSSGAYRLRRSANGLYNELSALKARTKFGARDDLVFPTSTGRRDSRSNVRRRVLLRAVERANQGIAEEGGCEPLPAGLKPHDLRRTFASWLLAEGEDPAFVMAQMGHTDPSMTLGLYAKALRSKRRRPHARRRAVRGRRGGGERPAVGGT
jgi:integrase